ncbi:MAG: DUF167 domain-containing protein [Caldisericia bacterium]
MNIKVKVTPNSKKNSIKDYKENILYVKISKPPIDNKANQELIEFLEKIFEVKGIKILSGEKSKEKIINIPFEEDIFKKIIKNLIE